MAQNRFDVRVAVGSVTGPRSSVWAIWSWKSEVYAAHRNMGGIQKFSFHTPTECRHAFTSEHGTPESLSDRALHVWHRDLTPNAGSGKVVRVLRIGASTDHLSTRFEEVLPAKTRWIEPAPSGGSTIIDLAFTNESEATVQVLLASEPTQLQHKLIAYKKLPNGQALFVSSWHSDKADKFFRVLAAPHDPNDLIILPIDPDDTGRPERLSLFSSPKNGDFLTVWEMGGYKHKPMSDAEWETMIKPFKPTNAD